LSQPIASYWIHLACGIAVSSAWIWAASVGDVTAPDRIRRPLPPAPFWPAPALVRASATSLHGRISPRPITVCERSGS
jgi:hypothetical protein